MEVVVAVALPVFAIVIAGYAAGRLGVLGSAASETLNRFVYWIALPPLLFLAMAAAPIDEVIHVNFVGAYLGGLLAVWAIGSALGWAIHREGPAVTTMQWMNASFSNTGYMGIPLFAAAFGQAGLAPASLATVIMSAVAVGIAVVSLEVSGSRRRLGAAVLDALLALARNPLVVSPLAGILVSLTGATVPLPVARLFDLMGAAASPCALFAIGLFLAGQRFAGDLAEVGWISVLKLAWQPLITYLLAVTLFPMEPFWQASAVLLAALPTGALTFVVAQRYGVYVRRTSATILVSTILSIVTLSLLLAAYVPRFGGN